MLREKVEEPCWDCGGRFVEVGVEESLILRGEQRFTFFCARKSCHAAASAKPSMKIAHKNWNRVSKIIRARRKTIAERDGTNGVQQ